MGINKTIRNQVNFSSVFLDLCINKSIRAAKVIMEKRLQTMRQISIVVNSIKILFKNRLNTTTNGTEASDVSNEEATNPGLMAR